MNCEELRKITILVLIAKRELKSALLSTLLESEIHLTTVSYGRGTVEAGYLKNTFGLAREQNKIVIIGVSTHTKVEAAIRLIVEKFNFSEPDTGIAFTVSIEELSY